MLTCREHRMLINFTFCWSVTLSNKEALCSLVLHRVRAVSQLAWEESQGSKLSRQTRILGIGACTGTSRRDSATNFEQKSLPGLLLSVTSRNLVDELIDVLYVCHAKGHCAVGSSSCSTRSVSENAPKSWQLEYRIVLVFCVSKIISLKLFRRNHERRKFGFEWQTGEKLYNYCLQNFTCQFYVFLHAQNEYFLRVWQSHENNTSDI